MATEAPARPPRWLFFPVRAVEFITERWPDLARRAPSSARLAHVNVTPFWQYSVSGLCTHPAALGARWVDHDRAGVAFLLDPTVPDGFFAALVQAGRGWECLVAMWRGGERRFWFRGSVFGGFGDSQPGAGERLAEALRRWDAGAPEVIGSVTWGWYSRATDRFDTEPDDRVGQRSGDLNRLGRYVVWGLGDACPTTEEEENWVPGFPEALRQVARATARFGAAHNHANLEFLTGLLAEDVRLRAQLTGMTLRGRDGVLKASEAFLAGPHADGGAVRDELSQDPEDGWPVLRRHVRWSGHGRTGLGDLISSVRLQVDGSGQISHVTARGSEPPPSRCPATGLLPGFDRDRAAAERGFVGRLIRPDAPVDAAIFVGEGGPATTGLVSGIEVVLKRAMPNAKVSVRPAPEDATESTLPTVVLSLPGPALVARIETCRQPEVLAEALGRYLEAQ